MKALVDLFRTGDWNQAPLVVYSNTVIELIDGHVISFLIDRDPAKFKVKGLIAPPAGRGTVKISFRNARLREK